MRVLVVGGSGFIGRHVVAALRSAEHAVVNADVRPPHNVVMGEQYVALNLLDAQTVERFARECGAWDGIVFLAAVIRQDTRIDERAQDDLRLMVEAPLRLARSLEKPPRVFVHASSIKVYSLPARQPMDEDHPTHPVTAYGVAKLCAEHYLDLLGARAGFPVTSLRLGFVYGPGQHAGNAFSRFIAAVRRGEAPVIHGDGSDVRDDIYVGDVARAVLCALDRCRRGVFNIASGQGRTLLEAAQIVCRLGRPGLAPRHVEPPGSWVDRVFAVERAREQLGFVASTSLDRGLEAMWQAAPR
ncbi:MAG: NAD-dependent epimerase/dehydratase family protein [Vicinamibacteria bacterium]|nr:NAD-dependent epimerase/dehydratase family protein [Vicinamibacteria bacterium]